MRHLGATAAVCMHLTSSKGMSLGCMGTWAPVLLDTNTFLTHSHPSTASSTVSFRGMVFPPRTAWSVVITTLAEAVEVEEESGTVKLQNEYLSHSYCYSPSRILFLRDSALNPAKITLRKKKEKKRVIPLALQWLYLSNERLGGHNIKLDITMEQVAHVGYSTPTWRAMPNLPTCGLLLFWRRPAWRLLAEERQAYRWLPGLPSSPPLSSGHLPPDTSAPEVVCRIKKQHLCTDPKLVSAY